MAQDFDCVEPPIEFQPLFPGALGGEQFYPVYRKLPLLEDPKEGVPHRSGRSHHSYIIFFLHRFATTRSPTSCVEYPILPADRLFSLVLTIFITALSRAAAAFFSPTLSNSIPKAQIAAR